MAARNAVTQSEAIEVQPTPVENDIAMTEEAILAAFDASDQNVTWDCRVIKMNGAQEENLFSVQPNELDGLMDRLRDSEGTGNYRVRVYRKVGGAPKVIYKAFDFRVKAPTRPAQPQAPVSDMSAVLQAIERQNARMVQMMENFMQRQIQPPAPLLPPSIPADPFDMMQKMVTAMSGMMAAMRPAEGASATDLIIKGVELANSLGGEKGETNMLDLVRDTIKSLPAIVEMANAQRVQLPTPAPVLPQQPRPVIAPAQTTNIPPVPPSNGIDPNATAQIRSMLLYLVDKARKNADPGFYADWIADNWPQETIVSIVRQPTLLTTFQSFVPEMTPYAAWFNQLLVELTKLVNDAGAANQQSGDVSGTGAAVNTHGNPEWGLGSEDDAGVDE